MRGSFSHTRGNRGFATLVVMVLLVLMMVFIVGNGIALRRMQRQLSAIDQRQRARLEGKLPGKVALPPNKPSSSPETRKAKGEK